MDLLGLVVQHVASFADDLRSCFMKYAKRMLALALISLPVLATAQIRRAFALLEARTQM